MRAAEKKAQRHLLKKFIKQVTEIDAVNQFEAKVSTLYRNRDRQEGWEGSRKRDIVSDETKGWGQQKCAKRWAA